MKILSRHENIENKSIVYQLMFSIFFISRIPTPYTKATLKAYTKLKHIHTYYTRNSLLIKGL